MSNILSDSSVLVTGGTGSFGQIFVDFALQNESSKVIVFSRDELKQAQMGLSHKNFRLHFYLGDVRDCDRLEEVMNDVDYVIHAAAMKRIEKCEENPLEAIKTNIDGSANIIKAALRTNVKRVVAISTDKVHEPSTLYGATKLIMERLFVSANKNSSKCHYSVARFGNLWGSRGSVVPLWKELSKTRTCVPLTDPNATRFFMTKETITDLILKALTGKEYLYTPKQLKSYKLSDLAIAMNVKTKLIGLRPYEKLHEQFDNFSSETSTRMTVEELRLALASQE